MENDIKTEFGCLHQEIKWINIGINGLIIMFVIMAFAFVVFHFHTGINVEKIMKQN